MRTFAGISFFTLLVGSLGWGQGAAPEPLYKVDKDVKPPRVISKVEPVYSDLARSRRIAGEVRLHVVINPDRTTRDYELLQPLGYGLDDLAVAAVRRWQFEPGTKDGRPVATRVTIEVTFDIPGSKTRKLREEFKKAEEVLKTGAAKKRKKALETVEKAARAGVLEAQLLLVEGHDQGKNGLDRDAVKAREWLRFCAVDAQYHACRYQLGKVLLSDPERTRERELEALAWLELATAQGSARASEFLKTVQLTPPLSEGERDEIQDIELELQSRQANASATQ